MVTDRSFSRTIGMSTFDLSLQTEFFFSLFPSTQVYRTEGGRESIEVQGQNESRRNGCCNGAGKGFIILNRNLEI